MEADSRKRALNSIMGSPVYADRMKVYDTLMFRGYRHLKIDHGKHLSPWPRLHQWSAGHWEYAKEGLIKHHAISSLRFPF